MVTFGEETEIRRSGPGECFYYVLLCFFWLLLGFCNVKALLCNKINFTSKSIIVYLPFQVVYNGGNLKWLNFDIGQIMIPSMC